MKRVLTSFLTFVLGYGSGFIRRVLPRLICCKLSLRLLQPSRRVLRGLRGRHRKRSLNVIAYLWAAGMMAVGIPQLSAGGDVKNASLEHTVRFRLRQEQKKKI